MKKSILGITVFSLMLASCSQDETIETTSREAITFGNAFIENATRASSDPIDNSYENEEFRATFEVYGTITNSSNQTANLFEEESVWWNETETKWVYDGKHTQYWIPGNTYNFSAIVDGNVENVTSVETDENGMPETIVLTDASQQKDILYAKSAAIPYQAGDAVSPVAFTFGHLLAKARVTVKNTMTTNSGYSYKVKNIFIEKTAKTAEYSIEKGIWQLLDTDGVYKPNFGNVVATPSANGADAVAIGYGDEYTANWERLFVPENNFLKITFTRELYRSDVLIETKTVTAQSKKVDFQSGYYYNFLIQLGNPGEPIQFSVQTINGWKENLKDKEIK